MDRALGHRLRNSLATHGMPRGWVRKRKPWLGDKAREQKAKRVRCLIRYRLLWHLPPGECHGANSTSRQRFHYIDIRSHAGLGEQPQDRSEANMFPDQQTARRLSLG